MSWRDRPSRLQIDGTDYYLYLAPTPDAYRTFYQTVWPTSRDANSGDPYQAEWRIDSWDRGEGEDRWEEGFYNKSTNVTPKAIGDGLVLGSSQTDTVNEAAATFADGFRFGLAQGKLWATADDATVHLWDPADEDFATSGWATGSSTAVPTSIIDQGDGTNLLIGYTGSSIRQVASGANATVTGLTYAYAPVLRNWGGVLFWLDGDDLYDFTMSSAAATETLLKDLGAGADSSDYLTNGYEVYNRMSSSDVGPIWYQRLNNGQTLVWEWNDANQAAAIIGKCPVDFATPYSIFWAHGFGFVGFRYAARHADAGDAFIWYFRSGQSGVAGPIRAPSGSTASKPILLAGMIGDDLMFYYDGAVWAYNLTSGGIVQTSDSTTSAAGTIKEAITFGQSVFISNVDSAQQVERHDRSGYSVRTATLDSGRHDFDTPGIDKALLSVTVVTEPLPASTSVSLSVSANGGSFTAVTGTHDDDSDTSHTFVVSSAKKTIIGEDFELRLTLAGTASATPTIRSVTARAIGVERRRVFRMSLDCRTNENDTRGGPVRSVDRLNDLRTILSHDGLARFFNAWDVEDYSPETEIEVSIEQGSVHEGDPGVDQWPELVLRQVSYA